MLSNKIFNIIFLVVSFSSCENHQKEVHKENTKEMIDVNSLDFLKQQKVEIDSFVSQNPKNLTVLVKLIDKKKLLKVENEKYPEPEYIETTFDIVKDNQGKIIYACEIPESQSGDWYIAKSHYFDENGNTFAFEMQKNEFGSMCAEITYETQTEYFESNFKLIGNNYILKDEKGKNLKKEDCDLRNGDHKVIKNVFTYLKTKNINESIDVYK